MSRKETKPQVLTANELLSGDVVFWSGSRWTADLEEAQILRNEPEREAALAEGASRELEVVGPYLAAVRDGGSPEPNHIRERLRSLGPSVRKDLGPQAGRHRD
jgi:hypothetical protein